VKYLDDRFVGQVRGLELHSSATPDQFRALRDDTRSISAVATAGPLSPSAASNLATAATLQIDRAPLNGGLGPDGWAQIGAKLNANLGGLNVPTSLIDQTLADMKAVAQSAGVSADDLAVFNTNTNRLRSAIDYLPSSPNHIEDPILYYSQHVRGFFRGWAAQKTADSATLAHDVSRLSTPQGKAVVARDVQLLQTLGSNVPSASGAAIIDAYAAAFANGSPTPQDLAVLQQSITTTLGPALTVRYTTQINRLISDAPAFFTGVGSSTANVNTLTIDVKAVVDDGAGSSLNPFRIEVRGVPTA
jgi:hypothetical protein